MELNCDIFHLYVRIVTKDKRECMIKKVLSITKRYTGCCRTLVTNFMALFIMSKQTNAIIVQPSNMGPKEIGLPPAGIFF